MNRKQIEQAPVGPELDALVAEAKGETYIINGVTCFRHVPCYWSTSIAAAWELVEEMRIWPLTRRRMFWRYLSEVVSIRIGIAGGSGLAYPAVFDYVEPEDFARAWLLAQPGVE